MNPVAAPLKPPRIRFQSLLRAVAGWLVLCVAVGLSVTVARLVSGWFALPPAGAPIIQAVLVTTLVVPTVLVLRRRVNRGSFTGLGLARRSLRPAVLGIAVALGAAFLTWAPAVAAGWVKIENVDTAALLTFIAVNTLVLLLYEALPEELALRGYAWATIRESWTPVAATIVVTALFPLCSVLVSIAQTGSALLLGVDPSGITLVPPGNDPINYFLQLILFGLALCAARRIPIPGALASAIAFHVVQLSVTRILLGGLGWINSGVSATFAEPDAIALVLVHIMLSGAAFLLIRKTLELRHAHTNGEAVAAN